MVKVFNKALHRSVEVNRIIEKIEGKEAGPSVVFIAGMHGNEPSGVFALKRVVKKIKEKNLLFKGKMYALAGNLWALGQGERFHSQDLNRLWSAERINQLREVAFRPENPDAAQQLELYQCLRHILQEDQGPFYFMDLHTTSCETIPFLLLNDSLLNRKFSSQYPLPSILGIEEYLQGPLLSYLNELGYIALGFEAGQHEEPSSLDNQIAFIMLSLVFAGCLTKEEADVNHYHSMLAKNAVDSRHFYEIFFRYPIEDGEKFKMEPGFVNFQKVKKGQQLAQSNGKTVYSPKKAKLFMPLYQSQGTDGFFAIRKVPRQFLQLSARLRKLKLHYFLPLLPGVSWFNREREVLKVNRKHARFFTKNIFHLLGYRSKTLSRNTYLMRSRELASREEEYKGANWF